MRIQFRQRGAGTKSIGERLFLTVFFGFFAALGTLFFVFMAMATWQTLQIRGWTETECTIEANSFQDAEAVEAAPGWQVRYRYAVAGQSFVSTIVSRGLMSRDTDADLFVSQGYVVGERATCYVNPGQPAEAVLRRESLWSALWGLFPLPFMAIGFGGMYFVWRRRRMNPDGTPFAPPVTAAARAAGASKGAWFAVPFFGLFLLIGVVATWALAVRPLQHVLAAREWPAVPCTIVSSGVEEHDSDDGYTYSVALVYRYEFGGGTYTANRYKFMGGSSSGRAGKAAIAAGFPAGSTAVCYVNPANPSDAVIERGLTGDMAFGLIPLVFVLVGAGGLIGFVVHRARAAGGGGMPREVSRGFHETPVRPVAPGSMSPGDATTLEARGSRAGKFVGLAIFALFWNGIISVFLFSLVSGWARGEHDWFLAVFLTPFVAIGLFMVGMSIHAGLALFNPRPRLRLSAATLAPGATLDLRWEMTGSAHRVRRFQITLEGREEATYRRGTDTHTDKSVFARIELADQRDATGIAAGATTLRLPADTMHSFTAKNNRIVWALRVHGDIPLWPDIDDEFPFTVLARGGESVAEGNHE